MEAVYINMGSVGRRRKAVAIVVRTVIHVECTACLGHSKFVWLLDSPLFILTIPSKTLGNTTNFSESIASFEKIQRFALFIGPMMAPPKHNFKEDQSLAQETTPDEPGYFAKLLSNGEAFATYVLNGGGVR